MARTENSVDTTILRKNRSRIQLALVILWVPLGLYIIFRCQHGSFSTNQCIFWMAASLLPIFLVDLMASLLTGESYAKGLSIYRENNPKLFLISTAASGLMLLLCIIGVIIYW